MHTSNSSRPIRACRGRPTTVRLDTYSSAPVAFSVYAVDPADVLTAGSNFSPRAIETSRRRPVLSFTFTPPGGYQFQSNESTCRSARAKASSSSKRDAANVGEQVWINRTRVGLVSKETPSGLLLYGADLGTGAPLARMRVQFVVNDAFATAMTDGDGIVRWNRSPRPVFALAQWGNSYAFLSLLPQAPLPATIVGVRTDSAVVHAGGVVRVVGFARTRSRGVLRASSGSALVSLRDGATSDRAAARAARCRRRVRDAPSSSRKRSRRRLRGARAGGRRGRRRDRARRRERRRSFARRQHRPAAGRAIPQQDVPLLVHASRGGVLRSRDRRPIAARLSSATLPMTRRGRRRSWLDETVRTDENGNATVDIPHPNDELGSTYGVHVESGGATADTRIVVPTAQAAIRLNVDRTEQSLGAPLGFDVYARIARRKAARERDRDRRDWCTAPRSRSSSLRSTGTATRAEASTRPSSERTFVFASVDRGGRAIDAAQVQVDPQAAAADDRTAAVRTCTITLGRKRLSRRRTT